MEIAEWLYFTSQEAANHNFASLDDDNLIKLEYLFKRESINSDFFIFWKNESNKDFSHFIINNLFVSLGSSNEDLTKIVSKVLTNILWIDPVNNAFILANILEYIDKNKFYACNYLTIFNKILNLPNFHRKLVGNDFMEYYHSLILLCISSLTSPPVDDLNPKLHIISSKCILKTLTKRLHIYQMNEHNLIFKVIEVIPSILDIPPVIKIAFSILSIIFCEFYSIGTENIIEILAKSLFSTELTLRIECLNCWNEVCAYEIESLNDKDSHFYIKSVASSLFPVLYQMLLSMDPTGETIESHDNEPYFKVYCIINYMCQCSDDVFALILEKVNETLTSSNLIEVLAALALVNSLTYHRLSLDQFYDFWLPILELIVSFTKVDNERIQYCSLMIFVDFMIINSQYLDRIYQKLYGLMNQVVELKDNVHPKILNYYLIMLFELVDVAPNKEDLNMLKEKVDRIVEQPSISFVSLKSIDLIGTIYSLIGSKLDENEVKSIFEYNWDTFNQLIQSSQDETLVFIYITKLVKIINIYPSFLNLHEFFPIIFQILSSFTDEKAFLGVLVKLLNIEFIYNDENREIVLNICDISLNIDDPLVNISATVLIFNFMKFNPSDESFNFDENLEKFLSVLRYKKNLENTLVIEKGKYILDLIFDFIDKDFHEVFLVLEDIIEFGIQENVLNYRRLYALSFYFQCYLILLTKEENNEIMKDFVLISVKRFVSKVIQFQGTNDLLASKAVRVMECMFGLPFILQEDKSEFVEAYMQLGQMIE